MAGTFFLEIVTPDKNFFSGEVDSVVLITPDGEIGILKGHTPMVVAVAIGPIKITKQGLCLEAVLSEGFMEVTQEKAVILTDSAEWPDEIDINRAKAAELRASERLQSNISKIEYMRSQVALQKALSRLKVTNDKKT